MEQDDRRLIERARGGDDAAFDTCVRRHADRVRATAYRLVGDVEDARDVAQEVFVRLHAVLDRFDPAYRFTTWLHKLTVNLAIDFRRRRGRRVPTGASLPEAEAMPDPGPGPDAETERNELHGAIEALAGELSDMQRQVFVLRDLQELPTAEIAEILDCRESTVRVHLARARLRVREALRERFPEFLTGGA